MKSICKAVSVLLALFILAVSVYGCAKSPVTEEGEVKGTETAPSNEPSKYLFDRKNADISEFESDPDWLSNGSAAGSDTPAEDMITVSISDRIDGEQHNSEALTFAFDTLPPYDEAADKEAVFDGVGISFTLYSTDSLMWDRFIETRRLSDKADWAYAVKMLLKRDYEQYSMPSGENPALCANGIRLFAVIENEDAPSDIFVVDENLYILHIEAPGMHGNDWLELDCAKVTERSVEPMGNEEFLRLYATALHYVRTGAECNADIFGVTKPESLEEGYSSMEIGLEYNGSSAVLNDPETVKAFIDLINDAPLSGAVLALDCAHGALEIPEGALKITAALDLGDSAEKGVYYILPDGRLAFEKNEPEMISSYNDGIKRLSVKAEYLRAYVTRDVFPFDSLSAFVTN